MGLGTLASVEIKLVNSHNDGSSKIGISAPVSNAIGKARLVLRDQTLSIEH